MTIHLSGQREKVVLSLLQSGKFASSDAVIDEALRLVEERYQEPDNETGAAGDNTGNGPLDRTARQLANLRRLGQKLDTMPTAAVADGLSNRDHDRMLYGK
jgi:Arc/MetJ-type ribon-helix-helix transcriptional regulator